MIGGKRFSVSESAPDTNDTALRNKRIVSGSYGGVDRADPSYQQQQNISTTLDAKRAESSLQHVRALNTQFASWVQAQLKNHPDELWEDGVQDYLAHASNIKEKFSDVVNWLKVNSASSSESKLFQRKTSPESLTSGKTAVPEIKNNSESKPFQWQTAPESLASSKTSAPEVKNNSDSKLFQWKTDVPPSTSANTSFTTSWSSGVFSNNQGSGGVLPNSQSSSMFSSSQTSGLFSNSQSTGLFSKSQGSGLFSNSSSSAVSSATLLSSSQSIGVPFNNQNSVLFSNSQNSTVSSISQNSGLYSFSNKQSPGVFSTNPTNFSFGGQNSTPTNPNTSDDVDDENELEQPSSPSVKKLEEKGILVVHEVKCKLYVKSTDASDKDAWKDKGMGQLYIKCKEGVSKGAKESKPTILVRNDAGRVVLNALLYPGIKINTQKNSIVAIFHTSGDDGGNNENAVARTFIIRMKTEEDRDKLAAAIKEYAPQS